MNSGVHAAPAVEIVAVFIVGDPFRRCHRTVFFHPVPVVVIFHPAGLKRRILVDPVIRSVGQIPALFCNLLAVFQEIVFLSIDIADTCIEGSVIFCPVFLSLPGKRFVTVNAAPAVEIISCSVNLFHSGVHHTVTVEIVSVVVIRDPFRCSTCAVRFQPVPVAFQLQPAGLNRTILIDPVSLISQLNPAGLAGMIDRSVILRYVGFSFYGKEGVSIYTTPAPEIIKVSIYFLKTIFIDCSVSLGIIKIIIVCEPAVFCHAAVPVRIQPVPVSIPVKPSCFQLSVLIKIPAAVACLNPAILTGPHSSTAVL